MNRRDFIKTGAGAFIAASASDVIGSGAPSNRVRLVVMGCHEHGRGIWVMRNALKVPGLEIAGVCDVDARARAFAAADAEKLTGKKPKQFSDIRKALEDPQVDGIICEAPDHWHATAAILAMSAGKAVYVEKPCSFCPAEGEAIVRVQKETGMVFQMGNQRRSSKVYQEVLSEFSTGAWGDFKWGKCWYNARRPGIGRGKPCAAPSWLDWDLWQGPAPRKRYRENVVHYKWHWAHHWGTGEMGNNSPHYLDIARWVMHLDYPQRVSSGGGKLFRRNEDWQWPDLVNVTYEFPEDKVVTFECVSSAGYMPYMKYSTGAMFHNEEFSLLMAPNDTAALYDRRDRLVKEWKTKAAKSKVGSTTSPVDGLDTFHMAKFAECVRNKDVKTFAPADEAHKSSLLAHLGNISLSAGSALDIDPSTGRPVKGSPGWKYWSREYEKGWEIS